jgi:Domain of unknown function (DUF1854)
MQNRITRMADFQLEHDAFGRLVFIETDGTRHAGVTPVRGFPISDPGRGISLISAEGHELAWIDDLAAVAPANRQAIEDEMANREFVPQIRRILHVSMPSEPCEWDVETDRGRTKFVLKSEDDVRQLDSRRAMIIDAHGIRYLIPDPSQLDRFSRRILERYL